MAKQKGGLGRGLGSLLGGASEEAVTPDEAQQVNDTAKNEPQSSQKKPAAPTAPASSSLNTPTPRTTESSEYSPQRNVPQRRSASAVDSSVYTSKEDNVTIKEVVERPVSQERATSSKTIKSEDQNKVISREADEIDIDLIQPNPDQPRTNFKKEDLEELAESIKRNGLLQPILVRKVDKGYQIIAGERRWQACQQLGLKKVPVRIKEADDDESIMLALIENIQRSDLNPIEEAYGYRRMMERGKMTQTQVAQAVSKGRSTVANALRLLELPEEAQLLLFEEKITAGHARAILSVPSKEDREKLTEKLTNENLSVRETEQIARLLANKPEPKQTARAKTPKSYKTVARTLRETLQTDVRVKSVKGKNKIEISFKDEADLERLFRLIASEA